MRTLAKVGDRAELVARVRRVTPASRRRWGRMTPHQMLCHVADAFRLGSGRRQASRADVPVFRTMLLWGALYVPLPWPPGIPTRPEVDPLREGTKPALFDPDRDLLVAELEAFAVSTSLDRRPHPLFGPMSAAAWLRWGWLHTDHHLRQFGL